MKKLLSLLLAFGLFSSVQAQELSSFLVEIDMRTFSSSNSLSKAAKSVKVLKSNGIRDVIIAGTEGRDADNRIISYLKPNKELGSTAELIKYLRALKEADINYIVDVQIGDYSESNLLFQKRPSYFKKDENGTLSINLNQKPAFQALRLDVKNLALNLEARGLRLTILQESNAKAVSSLIATVNGINEQLGRETALMLEGKGLVSMPSVNFDLRAEGENSWFYLPNDFAASSRLDKIAGISQSGIPVMMLTEDELKSENWTDIKALIDLYNGSKAFGSKESTSQKISVKEGAEMIVYSGGSDAAIYVHNKSSKKMKVKYKISDENLKGAYKAVFSGTPSFLLSKKLKITLQPGEFAFAQKK